MKTRWRVAAFVGVVMSDIIELELPIGAEQCASKPSQLLAVHSGLSQATIKDAMAKGAVWLQRGKRKKRLRRAGGTLQPGDYLQLNYNPSVLNQTVPEPELMHDAGEYTLWFKPFGMACQASRWGDFASINRWAEVNLAAVTGCAPRPAFLVHRLDRATTGLLLLCHSKSAAKQFSELFRAGKIDKRYRAVVHGDCSHFPAEYEVDMPVEGKASRSVISCIEVSDKRSLLSVKLLTGRKHQIRRHLSDLGFPIVGDRLYGEGSADGVDLQLQAASLTFKCPLTHDNKRFRVEDSHQLNLASSLTT